MALDFVNSPLTQHETITTTITYNYDKLYRLTAADYSSGEFFHYTYDAVGNRLTQGTQIGTTNYADKSLRQSQLRARLRA